LYLDGDYVTLYGHDSSGNKRQIQFHTSVGMQVMDQILSTGFVYAADYSAAGTLLDRWIPDYGAVKAYADSVATPPGGSDGQIQYNNSSVFGGAAQLYWDDINNRLGGNISAPLKQWHFSVDGVTPATTDRTTTNMWLTGSGYTEYAITVASNTAAHRGILHFAKARGSLGAPTNTTNGDEIGSINAAGYHTSAWGVNAEIGFIVDGATSAGVIPIAINFKVGSTGRSEVGRISSDGNFAMYNNASFGAGSLITPLAPLHVGGALDSSFYNAGDILGAFVATEGYSGFIASIAGNNAYDRPTLGGNRSRGTLASPTAVQLDDELVHVLGRGYDGTVTQAVVGIVGYVDGTVSSGNVPARLSFVTSAAGTAGRTERFVIKNDGKIWITGLPSDGDASDVLLLRDGTNGEITKLGIGTNLSVSGGNLNAASGGTPGGSDGDLQYNNAGSFGGFGDVNPGVEVELGVSTLRILGSTGVSYLRWNAGSTVHIGSLSSGRILEYSATPSNTTSEDGHTFVHGDPIVRSSGVPTLHKIDYNAGTWSSTAGGIASQIIMNHGGSGTGESSLLKMSTGGTPTKQWRWDYSGYVEIIELAASPGTPPTGYGNMYVRDDGKIYFKNDAGTEYDLTATGGTGNVSNTGTPLNNQLAIWTNSTTIEGDSNLTFDGTTLKLGTGRIQVQGTTAPTSGTGVEIGHTGTDGVIISYDRDLSAYKHLRLNALSLDFEISGTDYLTINSSGNAKFIGNVGIGDDPSSGSVPLTVGGSAPRTQTYWTGTSAQVSAWMEIDASDNAGFMLRRNGVNEIYLDTGGTSYVKMTSGGMGFGTVSPSTGYVDVYDKILRVRAGGKIISRQETAGVAQTLITVHNSSGGDRAYITLTASNEPEFFMRNSSGSNKMLLRGAGTFSFGASTSVTSGYIMELFGTNNKGRAADWYATSDRRLKENIKPFGSVIERISKMAEMLVTYNRIGEDRLELGFIAQDVLPLFPEIVGGSEKEMYDISYGRVGAIALQGVAELERKYSKKIAKLEDEIYKLKKIIYKFIG
jgi:hypothetical protein